MSLSSFSLHSQEHEVYFSRGETLLVDRVALPHDVFLFFYFSDGRGKVPLRSGYGSLKIVALLDFERVELRLKRYVFAQARMQRVKVLTA